MTARAFITGIGGQDGTYLAERLVSEGTEVHALVLTADGHPAHCPAEVVLHTGDLGDLEATRRLVLEMAPQEVYNLAAISSVAQSWDEPDLTAHVNGQAAVALMESARQARRRTTRAGVERRDLRRGRRVPADRGHADPAGEPLRRREGVRAPVGRRLPPARPARLERHPLQPRVAAAPRALRDPQDHLDRGRDRPRRRRRAGDGQPRRPPRLGLGPRLRRRDGPGRAGRRAGRLRRRDRPRALRTRLRGCRLRRRRHRRLGAARAPGRALLPPRRPDRAGRRRVQRPRGARLGADRRVRGDRDPDGGRRPPPASSRSASERAISRAGAARAGTRRSRSCAAARRATRARRRSSSRCARRPPRGRRP